jgi:hypothetical protein
LQKDLDLWIRSYNEERPHQGRWCFGKTPLQTFLDAIPIAKKKKTRCLITDQTKNQTTPRHCLSGQIQATTTLLTPKLWLGQPSIAASRASRNSACRTARSLASLVPANP